MGLLDVDDEELGETTPLVLEKVDTINDLQEGGSLLGTVGEKGEDRNKVICALSVLLSAEIGFLKGV